MKAGKQSNKASKNLIHLEGGATFCIDDSAPGQKNESFNAMTS